MAELEAQALTGNKAVYNGCAKSTTFSFRYWSTFLQSHELHQGTEQSTTEVFSGKITIGQMPFLISNQQRQFTERVQLPII